MEADQVNENLRAKRSALKRFAEEQPMPARFSVTASSDLLIFTIVDTATSRCSDVPVFAYKAVRKTLFDLFN